MNALEVRGLCKSFGGISANHNVSFEVRQGTIVGLIGPNGAGKTTLFNGITGHDPPTKGDVLLEGVSIRGKRPDVVCRKGLVRTWQKVRPLARMSVLDNVIVGALLRTNSLRVAREIAAEQLDFVKMHHRASVLAAALPIGERKKLEIARLLATSPRVLLLDEVMGGLNPSEREELMTLLFELKHRGLTQVVVEHDVRAIMKISDRVVVLRSGEMLAEGTPSEVANSPEVIAAYLGERGRA